MNGFDECRKITERGMKIVLPYLRRGCKRLIVLPSGPEHMELQVVVGDYLMKRDGRWFAVEFKAEESNEYGNLFLETWSNRKTGREGWIETSESDRLNYFFIASRELLYGDMGDLQKWFQKHKDDYPEKPQRKREQHNDTWGRPVPIKKLLDAGLIETTIVPIPQPLRLAA